MAANPSTDGPNRCVATVRRTGERCKKAPIAGATVCRFHGGAAPQVRAKAARRLAETQAMKMLEQLGADPADDRHPIDHLLEELRQAAVASDYLGSIAVMEGPKSALWRAWERERDRRAKLAKLALEAGVEERRVRVAEEQAEQVAAVLRAVLTSIGSRLHGILQEHLVPADEDGPMIVLDHQDRANLEGAVKEVTIGREGLGIVREELRKLGAGGDAGHGTDDP